MSVTAAAIPELPEALLASGKVGTMWRWCRDALEAAGILDATFEARLFVAHSLAIEPDLAKMSRMRLEPDQMQTCRDLLLRRAAGEPFQYILGEVGFWKGMFYCRPGVLIPRTDTEILVFRALRRLPQEEFPRARVLELGTGSGAPIIALAMEAPGHHYYGTDLSREALGLAMKNARRNGVEGMVEFFQGDWWQALILHGEVTPFDLIVINPPYVRSSDLDVLPIEIREHEPVGALDGGPTGLDFYHRTMEGLERFLRPGGWLIMEFGDGMADAVWTLYEEAGLEDIQIQRDLHNLPRTIEGRRPEASGVEDESDND